MRQNIEYKKDTTSIISRRKQQEHRLAKKNTNGQTLMGHREEN